MYIKLKDIITGEESVVDTGQYHIALKFTPLEFEQIQSMAPTEDGKALSGASHRTFACIFPDGEEEMQSLGAWAKSE